MSGLLPYITFPGNCREAINFYKTCFGGEVTIMQFYGDTPMEFPEEVRKKVMHAEFNFQEGSFMAADSIPGIPLTTGNNIAISVHLHDKQKAERYFKALAEGGTVTMEWQETFWGAYFGMITDKFGINWMLNCDEKK